jgi:hypothetical protein
MPRGVGSNPEPEDMMTDAQQTNPHLDDLLVARYLDRACDQTDRDRVEGHLAECSTCREELGALSEQLRTRPPRRRPAVVPWLAAAAALALVVWGVVPHRSSVAPTRDLPITAALAPTPLQPLGTVVSVEALRWNAVPGAERYRLTLFSTDGQPLWQVTVPDTVVALPRTVGLRDRITYYWQVKAETDYGRWVESELVAFTLVPSEGAQRP